jgi:metal-responsive CopG/Arc/MetJ family transcriptional regulator
MMAPNQDGSRQRQSIRLEAGVWVEIDAARAQRSGKIPRNTWIAEAIAEKLARERPQESRQRVGADSV